MRSRDWSSDVCSSDLPEARAELFGVIARLSLGLGDYDDAATLLDRQTAILDALDNVPPSLRLEPATDLGHTRRMLGRHSDCIGGMRPWKALDGPDATQQPQTAAVLYPQPGHLRTEERRG